MSRLTVHTVGKPDREIEIEPPFPLFKQGEDVIDFPCHVSMEFEVGFPYRPRELTVEITTPEAVYHGTIRRPANDGER